MEKKKILYIGALVLGVTVLHYSSKMAAAPMHEFYRELYFIPAILAGLWLGRIGGLITSVVITILFLPHMMHSMSPTVGAFLVNASEMVLLNIGALASGYYSDSKRGLVITLKKPYRPDIARAATRKYLLIIDDTAASLYATDYFATTLGQLPDTEITLLNVIAKGDIDAFESAQEALLHDSDQYWHGTVALAKAKEILIENGVPEPNIQQRSVARDGGTKTTDVILKELGENNYDGIIIGKHPMTKPQEFLFGSTTITLVREAPVNIISVKMPPDAGSDE